MSFEIHDKLKFEDYRKLPGYNASSLKRALESPLEYYHYEQNGWPDSDTLRMGRAGHTMTLEPQRSLAEYVQWETEHPDGRKRPRNGHAWEDFKSANAGKTILTPEQFATATAIRDIVRDHPEAGPLVKGVGRNELSLRFMHRRAGVWCKTRLDRVTPNEIVEIKLTHDISDHGFGAIAAKLRYPMQTAMQRDAAEACGLGRLPVVIIAIRVAKNKPIDLVVYDMLDEDLAQGQEDYERAIEIVESCRKNQEWPGVQPNGRRTLMLPEWSKSSTAAMEPIDFGAEVIQ